MYITVIEETAMPIWNPEIETMSRDNLKELQLEKLKKCVAYVYERIPHYKNKMDSMGLKPSDIKTLEDIKKLPMTTKDDLRDHYPYGLFAVPMKDVVRIHASSGTTGRATVVGYTRNVLDLWSEVVARFISATGVTSEDIIQIAFGYGLFTGGFGLHYGMEKIGASVIPVSSGNTQRQIKIMQDFGTTTLICTPSYALYIVDAIKEEGLDPKKDLNLKYGLFGGEPWTNSMRVEIEKGLGILATDNYGLSEIIGPGVSGECHLKDGMHIAEDHFFVEVIDPETGEWVPEGEPGELVITPLDKEALPLFRYRTKDLAVVTSGKCACGRTTMRMSKVRGRTDDMLIIRA
jgi:phenylacetate-CoA ligase